VEVVAFNLYRRSSYRPWFGLRPTFFSIIPSPPESGANPNAACDLFGGCTRRVALTFGRLLFFLGRTKLPKSNWRHQIATSTYFFNRVAPELKKSMSEIARRVVGHTAKNFPIMLVGIGLVTTVLWVSTVVAVALDRIWSALSGM